MKKIILSEIDNIHKLGNTDQLTIDAFVRRINQGKLIKRKNLSDHLCSFFVPVHKPTRSIYLCHHIKAATWIPPGGHIEPGETPKEAVYREFDEELGHYLGDEPVYPFTLSISDIKNPNHSCRRHYDIWYIVECDRMDFKYDRGEFHDAGWIPSRVTMDKCNYGNYKPILRKIDRFLHSD